MKILKCSIALFLMNFLQEPLNGQPCKSEKFILNDSLVSYLLSSAELSVECVYDTPYRQVLLKKDESYYVIEYNRDENNKIKKSLSKELCIDSSLSDVVAKIYLLIYAQESRADSMAVDESSMMTIALKKKNYIGRFHFLKSQPDMLKKIESIRSYIAAKLIIPNISDPPVVNGVQ